jgi:hypothetical protein
MAAKKTIEAIALAISLLLMQIPGASFAESGVRNPKVLIFTTIDIRYLIDSIGFWGKEAPVNGFILSYVADWWTTKEKLAENGADVKALNQRGAAYGIDSNFVKISLGYGRLPIWTDDVAWKQVTDNFKNIAEFVRATGTKGIAIDTESYEVPLFDAAADQYKSIPRDVLRAKIFQRGQQIMGSLTSAFPDIEIFVLPEGALYWFNPGEGSGAGFELWIDFFDGMASVKNRNGIILGSERTYSVLARDSLERPYRLIDRTMYQHSRDPQFWKEKCTIAIGMWPLGKTYSDKSSRYSAREFEGQFLQAASLSPRYVWIYDHGVAWFRMTPAEVSRYTENGRWIWGKEYQTLPTDPAIQDYYRVLRRYREKAKSAAVLFGR